MSRHTPNVYIICATLKYFTPVMRVPRCLAQDLDFNLDLLWGGAPTTRDWIPRALWPLPGEGQKPFPTFNIYLLGLAVSQATNKKGKMDRIETQHFKYFQSVLLLWSLSAPGIQVGCQISNVL
jgi:hypothetical protein